MKMTTFNPEIISKDADSIIKLFEELGFEQRHKKTNIEGKDITMVRMKDSNGFHVDVVHDPDAGQDTSLIRMNVDDFGEAYELLIEHGFRNIRYNEEAVFTEGAKQSRMISPSGFEIDLCLHIKDLFYNFRKRGWK